MPKVQNIFELGFMTKEKVSEQIPTLFQRAFVGVMITVIGLSLGISVLHSFGIEIKDVEYWRTMAVASITSLFSYFLGGNMRSKLV